MFLSKNLRHLRERSGKKISQGKLAESVGVTRSAISSYEDGRAEPKLSVLNNVARYFNITVDQLLNLDLVKMEDAEIQRQHEVRKYASAENLRILAITVNDEEKENVEMIPETASAGYAHGYADEAFLMDKPKYKLPFLPKGRTYRAFEINGDSMYPLLPHQAIVIGEYMANFNDVKNGQICVVVTRKGIVLKKVYNKIKERNKIQLRSSNIHYKPYELDVEDIIEIWAYKAYISQDLPDEATSSTSLLDLRMAVERLEADMLELKVNQDQQKLN